MSHVLVFNLDQAIATFLMRVFIGRHVRTGDASGSTGAAAGAGVGSGAVSIGSQHNLLATAHEAMWGFPYSMQHAPCPMPHSLHASFVLCANFVCATFCRPAFNLRSFKQWL